MTFNFSEWWETLSAIQQIYWIVTIPATLIFLIQLLLTIFGGDVDVDGDIGDMDHDMHGGDSGFHFLSIKNMIAFFTIFGWTGLGSIYANISIVGILLISIISGLIMMTIMASIYYFMSKLTASGTIQMKNAIGVVGDVYIRIPAKRGGLGQVQVKVQGSLRTLEAMTDEEEEIKSGSLIEVVEIINDQILLVEKATNNYLI